MKLCVKQLTKITLIKSLLCKLVVQRLHQGVILLCCGTGILHTLQNI